MRQLQNWVFQQLHGNKLIYNTCWEDPRCDRQLLQLQNDSRLVMITSAGDNLLDYLLEDPAEIHAVDVNYRQNALFELKRSMLQHGNHGALFQFFGEGYHGEAHAYYQKELRDTLPAYARQYWDRHIHYFKGKGKRNSFYFRGTAGILAYLCRRYLYTRKLVRQNVDRLMEAQSLAQQEKYYQLLEAKLFTPFLNYLLNRHLTMSLAGVPRAQQHLMQKAYAGGNAGYIRSCLRSVFTQLDIGDNYFYQVYFRGHYTKDCCPEYLREDNFDRLKAREGKASTYNSTLTDFLKNHPGAYSHYVLLDHQDWLASHDPDGLAEEWRLILQNSQPGTRILLRSAAREIDFFPPFVQQAVHFDYDLTQKIHPTDRVGTYASVYLGIVK